MINVCVNFPLPSLSLSFPCSTSLSPSPYDDADQFQRRGEMEAATRTLMAPLCHSSSQLEQLLLSSQQSIDSPSPPPASRASLFSNLGVLLKQQGQLEIAIRCYKTAARLESFEPGHRYRLGNAYLDKIDYPTAVSWYRAATRLAPSFAEAYNNMGNCLVAMTRLDLGLWAYEKAAESAPNAADYLVNLAGMQARTDGPRAVETYRKAIKLNPKFPEAYNNMANLLRDLNEMESSAQAYESALNLRRNDPAIITNLQSTLDYLCDWRGRGKRLKELMSLTRKQLREGVRPDLGPFYANTFSTPPDLLLLISRSFSEAAEKQIAYLKPSLPAPINIKPPLQRLSLGIISSDLTRHIVGHGMAGLLSSLQPTRFNFFCFALATDDSETRAQIEKRCKTTNIEGWPVESVSSAINVAKVQILIDLNGHTKGNRIEILAARPAPVQVLFHGYAGTSGADFIQFFIGDRIATPPEHASHFAEALLYMPHTYFLAEDYARQLAASRAELAQGPTRTEVGFPENATILACFNNLYKLDQHTFNIWIDILRSLNSNSTNAIDTSSSSPSSASAFLWLLRLPAAAEKRIRQRAKEKNIEDHTLVFSDLFDRKHHLRYKALSTLFLDTPQYNGHSTASDALAAGLPLLSLPGGGMVSRSAASQLMAVGLSELIARTKDEYRELGIRLVNPKNRKYLENLRAKLKLRGPEGKEKKKDDDNDGEGEVISPLFDRTRWANGFDRLMRLALENHLYSSSANKKDKRKDDDGERRKEFHVIASGVTTRQIKI